MHKIFTNTLFVGKKVLFLPSCHSTNSIASEMLARETVPNGQLIITDYQENGRGQRGNSWESEKGKNLLFSLVLTPHFLDASEGFMLNVVTSVAITDTLSDYLPSGVAIKWPNDIYFDNKKLCGMLLENTLKNNCIYSSVIGVGININQTHFANPNAISLSRICNQEFDREDFLSLLLSKFEARFLQLKKGRSAELMKTYHSRMYWRDEIHVFKDGQGFFNGKILGVNKVGKLHMELENEERLFNFKEIEFIR